MPKIDDLRRIIDGLDDRILEILNERARVVIEIGAEKKKEKSEIRVPDREKAIIDRLSSNNPGPFPSDSISAVFREIFSASRALEQPIKVAHLGPKATFSHLACLQHFGYSAQYVPVDSIKDVFSEVERGLAEYGVVPVENSTEGAISSTLDMFIDSDLKITGEIMLEVSLYLLNRTGKMEDIKKVYSHPQPLAQCRDWLNANSLMGKVISVQSTTTAADIAAKDDSAAAIASSLAAEVYGLKVVREKIEDKADNTTRFFIIAKKPAPKSGKDKTSILFSIKDRPGALYDMLKPFAAKGINLTKIESRPSRRKAWEYFFFVDMEGYADDEKVKEALTELEKNCTFLKVLGAYPAVEGRDSK